MNGRRVVPLLAALQVVTLATGQAQGDQQALAQRILTGNVAEQDGAVWTAMTLGSQAGPELRAALITLLKRNNRVRDEAAKRKVAVATLDGGAQFLAPGDRFPRLKEIEEAHTRGDPLLTQRFYQGASDGSWGAVPTQVQADDGWRGAPAWFAHTIDGQKGRDIP